MAVPAVVGADLAGFGDEVLAYALAHPLLVGLGLLGGAAVLTLLWAGYRRLRRTKADTFLRALDGREGVAVLMHPNPDPDAMGSALGVARLAESVGTTAVMQYPGQIRHEENRVFQNVLELDLERIESVEDLSHDGVVLVDHNEPRGFEGVDDVHPFAVVDHHPGDGQGSSFTDIRSDYGATATILAEYYYDLGFEAEETVDRALGADLATALMYGIYSDTNRLTRGYTSADFAACAYLCEAADVEMLERIADPEVDAEVLDVRARAIANRESDGPYVVSDVGEISNVDAIGQAADELLRLEGTTTVVVYGTRDGYLHISGRSRDDRVHMGRALSTAFEGIPMAEAGGHARMGAGQLSLEHLSGLGPSSGLAREELSERLFDVLTGDV